MRPDWNQSAFVLLAALFLGADGSASAQQAQPQPAADEGPFLLEPFVVGEGTGGHDYDPTGMDVSEAELNEPPFSNGLLAGTAGENPLEAELNTEVLLATGVSAADLAAGVTRVNLRGFPTPRLRNGFTQNGIPEVLNSDRLELIQGPLTPVTGKAAPGGIQNFVTGRPRGRDFTRIQAGASTSDTVRASVDSASTLRPRKAWVRWGAGWSRRDGPEPFAYSDTATVSATVVLRHNKRVSTLVAVDHLALEANGSPGVPEYRETRSGPILGPYLPLAGFHAWGPNAGQTRRTTSASAQTEITTGGPWSFRAGFQAFRRGSGEDRWTLGQYVLETHRFSGVREPQRLDQALSATALQADATARFSAGPAEHKVSASVELSRAAFDRIQLGLERADRDALPADVRFFDPAQPNFFRPAFSPALYRRVITDRTEDSRFASAVVSGRSAYGQGRLVATAGLRFDTVDLDLEDRRPGAAMAQVTDRTHELTWHAGANFQVIPSRLLVFANTSTAWEPSTRVDARTGNLQGNETTEGVEAGFKGVFLKRRLTATAMAFAFTNGNISRRNPRYNDPILDSNLQEPELVAAGEEEFTGATLEMQARPLKGWTVSGVLTYTDARTTASPDLPEEVGRRLTRMPRVAATAQARYTFADTSALAGLSAGFQATHVGDVVVSYANDTRALLSYPSYTLVSANASFALKRGKISHTLALAVRNLLDEDLLRKIARTGAGRELTGGYTLAF